MKSSPLKAVPRTSTVPATDSPARGLEIATTGHHQLLVPLRDTDALRACRIESGAYQRLRDAGAPDSIYPFALGARVPLLPGDYRLTVGPTDPDSERASVHSLFIVADVAEGPQ